MTTFADQSVVCGACGQVFTHQTWEMTSSFGSPDLDNRQPEMDCAMLRTAIQRCPSCGYCSGNLRTFDPAFRAVMDSPSYRSQLADPNYSPLASAFICAAMIAESAGRPRTAGLHRLAAAWALEGEARPELAAQWRSNAADTLLAMLRSGNSDGSQPGLTEAIIADCLRRSGRGTEALPIIETALAQPYAEVIHSVLRFQHLLIQRGDTARHSIKEAVAINDTSA